MSSVAAAAGSAKVPEGGDSEYLSPGDYLLQATGHKENTSDGRLAFIAEHDVLESAGVAVPSPEDKPTLNPGQSGTLYVDCKIFKGGKAWMVKAYLAALTKSSEEDIDADGIEAVLSTDQPYVGGLVRCKAWTHVTKNGARITHYKFTPASAEDAARAADLRKGLGLPPLAVVE